jgi:hypothetical protein
MMSIERAMTPTVSVATTRLNIIQLVMKLSREHGGPALVRPTMPVVKTEVSPGEADDEGAAGAGAIGETGVLGAASENEESAAKRARITVD